MEVKVSEVQMPAQITFNYEELKTELTERVHVYETVVYTEDQIKGAKEDRANLNKLKKALTDERIRREKEYMAPFNDFKAKITELCGIIDKASGAVDAQVKAFEEKQKEEKRNKVLKFKADAELLNAEQLQGIEVPWSDKWMNASASMKSIEDEINTAIEKIIADLATLATLPEFGFEAVEVYKSTLDINRAISEAQRMAQIAKAKAEKEAREAEAKRRQAEYEAELARQREAAKAAEVPEVVEVAEEQHPAAVEYHRQWLAFQAYMTVDDALALKAFFETRGIEYKAV